MKVIFFAQHNRADAYRSVDHVHDLRSCFAARPANELNSNESQRQIKCLHVISSLSTIRVTNEQKHSVIQFDKMFECAKNCGNASDDFCNWFLLIYRT